MQKEISFAGNCLSGGDVVPRDTEFVLNMKRGDCKDHATLLQAMLSSAGIPSTQALIDRGEMYELPELPCWQAFNHVINYLPDFKTFVDATSTRSPFGELPSQERGKAVLLTQTPARLDQTSTAPPTSNWSRTRNTVQFEDDGSMSVESALEFGGSLAHAMRHNFAERKNHPTSVAASACLNNPLSVTVRTLVKIISTFGCSSAAAAALQFLPIAPLLPANRAWLQPLRNTLGVDETILTRVLIGARASMRTWMTRRWLRTVSA